MATLKSVYEAMDNHYDVLAASLAKYKNTRVKPGKDEQLHDRRFNLRRVT